MISLKILNKLEIRDSQNLGKLGKGCTVKMSNGGGERWNFCFYWNLVGKQSFFVEVWMGGHAQ